MHATGPEVVAVQRLLNVTPMCSWRGAAETRILSNAMICWPAVLHSAKRHVHKRQPQPLSRSAHPITQQRRSRRGRGSGTACEQDTQAAGERSWARQALATPAHPVMGQLEGAPADKRDFWLRLASVNSRSRLTVGAALAYPFLHD